jgi:hypothetical protein
MKKLFFCCLLTAVLVPVTVHADDYIIKQNIGEFQFIPERTNQMSGHAGAIVGSGHWNKDHSDITWETRYIHDEPNFLGVSVQVTIHGPGGEGNQWLLHEVERGIRSSKGLDEKPSDGSSIRETGAFNIFYYTHPTYGGAVYRWISPNNVVLYIDCNSCNESGKPEPLEVVQAYLSKYPSTITMADSELKSHNHSIQWLRDEMERRIWLSEKWITLMKAQSNPGELSSVKDHLTKFMEYRKKYLGRGYGSTEVQELWDIEKKKDIAGMEKKVKAYRDWWNNHKTDSLSNVP